MSGEVKRFETSLKVPHIGWNKLNIKKKTPLFEGIDDLNFYFVHSYHASGCRVEDIETTCDYAYEFTASVNKDNVWGVQFHPEKTAPIFTPPWRQAVSGAVSSIRRRAEIRD